MKTSAPLWYCMDCESFTHPQIYTEPDETLRRAPAWHISVEERNTRYATNLFNAIQRRNKIKSVLEIGCGTGTVLAVAKKRGLKVCGFDTNPYLGDVARERHGIEICNEYWNNEKISEKYDVVLAISVMEHLTDPNLLMREIATYCRRHGSASFISVPFSTERERWPTFLLEPVPKTGNPLHLVDVHINHFSRKGFEKMARAAGASHVESFPYGWFYSYWLRFE